MDNNNILNEIEKLGLTEHDFKILNDGLEALPDRGMAGELRQTYSLVSSLKMEKKKLK